MMTILQERKSLWVADMTAMPQSTQGWQLGQCIVHMQLSGQVSRHVPFQIPGLPVMVVPVFLLAAYWMSEARRKMGLLTQS